MAITIYTCARPNKKPTFNDTRSHTHTHTAVAAAVACVNNKNVAAARETVREINVVAAKTMRKKKGYEKRSNNSPRRRPWLIQNNAKRRSYSFANYLLLSTANVFN